MAGKRNAEGIALLSVYGDVDSDNELEDSPAASPLIPTADPPGSIVDYAHDEGAGTPDHKGMDVGTANEETTVDDMQTDEGGLPEQVSASPIAEVGGEPSAANKLEEQTQDNSTLQESINNGGGEIPSAEKDVLSEFWPSPPSTPCSTELQWKERGRSFNEDLRNSKGYRNPYFLQLAVVHQKIDEIGSCFDPDIFNPHGYDKSDFADALAAEQRKESERKENERRQNQRTNVDFVRATQLLTTQKGLAVVASHTRLGEANHATITTTTSLVHTSSTSEVRSESRTNKKSKWDKAGHH